jgi:hypothetical protein
MLVVNGFFENGVFIPEKPLAGIIGRQKAVLRIDSEDEKGILDTSKASIAKASLVETNYAERMAAAERLVGSASKNAMTFEEIRNERLARQ